MELHAQGIAFQSLPLSEAKALAEKEGKPLFVDFFTTWCAPCKQMENEVFVDATVAEYMNQHFISLRIDAEKQDLEQVRILKVVAYPTLLFFDSNGKVLQRQEGALDATDFLARAKSVNTSAEYEAAYLKKPTLAINVYNYTTVLQWSNPNRAGAIARKYLTSLKEEEYVEEYNWKLIQQFISARDKYLFGKVIGHQMLPNRYPEEFKAYLLHAVNGLLDFAIEQKYTATASTSTGYVKRYPTYFTNPDSIVLVMDLRFADALQTPEFIPLLRTYVETYLADNPEERLAFAKYLIERYFKRDVLAYAEELAELNIRKKPTAKAYLTKALANERMNNFRTAFANLLLAYDYADDEVTVEQLDEYKIILNEKLAYQFADGVNTNTPTANNNDGRFTLGAGTKRLMFGFPVPESTSHFIVNVDGKLASNAPHFRSDKMAYINGIMKYEGDAATPRVTVEFQFNDIIIVQVLTPVDKEGNEVATGFAQYYKLSYEFKNKSSRQHIVGLAVLFDTMVDDNDNCNIMAGKRAIPQETKFSGDEVPASLQFYRTPKDISDHMGEALIRGFSNTPPDHVLIGRWPTMHNLTWNLTAARVPYGDSAYMLQWEKKRLTPKGSLLFTTYYGLPKFKKAELQAVMKGEVYLTKKIAIYFNLNSDELDLNAKMQLSTLAEDTTLLIRGVMLNGYSDITGITDYNFDLSKRRIAIVGHLFESYGIAFVPKPYGVNEAQRNEFDKTYGNTWDRRVDVIVYYRVKNSKANILVN